ncbi:MAG: 50S ribosomal protein L22 [Parcubacteria group bacterium]|nr:50S ribosomal protein L22 [Parcubacteria group bacterium]
MEIKASLKYLRIAPRKTRLVTKLIKGLSVPQAEAQLMFIKNRSAEPILKLLKSAISNAENNFHLNKDNLFIKSIRVDEGPALKRFRPRARGAAYPIKKRTSHVNIVLAEIYPQKAIVPEKKVEHKEEKTEEIKPVIPKEEKPKKSFKPVEEKITKKVLPKQKLFRRKAI